MKTNEIEEAIDNLEEFDEKLISDNAPSGLHDLIEKYMDEQQLTKSDVIRMLNVDRNYGYKILNGIRTPTRNCLIQLAFIFKLNVEQINYMLRLAGKSPLYVRNVLDARVFFAVKHNLAYDEAMEFIWNGAVT